MKSDWSVGDVVTVKVPGAKPRQFRITDISDERRSNGHLIEFDCTLTPLDGNYGWEAAE